MPYRPTPLIPLHLAATLSLALALPSLAAANPVFELTDRSSQMSMNDLRSAFGTAEARLLDDSIQTTALSPGLLTLSGGGYEYDEDFLYSVDIEAAWSLWQDHSTTQVGADTVLSAEGGLALTSSSTVCNAGICAPGTAFYLSTNFQTLAFSLSEATAFQAQGLSSREQSVNVRYSADGGQSWSAYNGWNSFFTYGGSILNGPQGVTPWSLSGTFTAGLYQVSNSPNGYGTPSPNSWFSWDYDITLLGTTLAAPVPEPGAWALMAAGLGVLMLRRHRPAA